MNTLATIVSHVEITTIIDTSTPACLLPEHLLQQDNAEDRQAMRVAREMALEHNLTAIERDLLEARYTRRMTYAEIGIALQVSPVAVHKRIKRIEAKLQEYAESYYRFYQAMKGGETH